MVEEIILVNEVLDTSLSVSMDSDDYVLESVDWGSIESSNTSYKFINQVGVYVTSTSLESRNISIIGWVVADSLKDMKRRKDFLNRFINPLQRLILQYKDYQIEGIPQSSIKYGALYPENNDVMCKFLINLFCPDPTFHAQNPLTLFVAQWIPKLRFPLRATSKKKIIFGLRSPSTIATLWNEGALPCGFIVIFQAHGQVRNPGLVDIQTQQEIRFDYTMNAGESLEVSTIPNLKKVKRVFQGVSVNGFNLLDLERTTFFSLRVGENFLRYSADQGIDNLTVSIKYDPRYLEVQE